VTELIDTHAHLQEPEFAGDADAAIQRAADAGVTGIVVPAVDLASARRGLELARRYEGVYAAAGYHPHEASKLDDESLSQIEALLDEPRVVAVGEIGLDFYRMHSTEQEQLAAFEAMLALAERRAMPVIVHCRDAWEAMREQLLPWARRVAPRFEGRPPGVLHYFSGTLEEAQRYVELGFVISVHTSVTHPKQQGLRDVVSQLPLETLVVETDSPYGAPQSQRGKPNEPAFVVEAARQIAILHNVDLDYIGDVTSANARRLFGLPVTADVTGGHG
jgi:TatD DNase family protein